jgi:DNA polymerase-3 subunit delta
MKETESVYPVYFIYGVEDFLAEEEVRRLMDQTLAPGGRSFNLHLFNGAEDRSQDIIQTARTIPMLSPYRFILVREAGQLSEGEVEDLMDYVKRPSRSTCLVFRSQDAGPWKEHLRTLGEIGKVVEYPRLKGKALLAWIKKRMEAKGKTLAEDAAYYLQELVGDRLQDLDNVLERIFLSTWNKKNIQLQDIEGVLPDVKLSTVFELADAIGQQNIEKALGILKKVLESNVISFRKEEASKYSESEVYGILLGNMARQYRLIWKVKELGHGRTTDEIARTVGIRSAWVLKKLTDQARNFSESSLREGLLKCQKTDLAIKRGRGPKDILIEKLVIDLCRPGTKAHR